jgi:glycosyltransferase involved in cell wall biosynthesis
MTVGQPFRPAIIAPTFNNAQTLSRILTGMDPAGLPIIVIDDGCSDFSPQILRVWADGRTDRTVLTHAQNQGKAAALLTGFNHALQMGFTHAVTIDTDGQLDPTQIPDLLEFAGENPLVIVVGCRDQTAADYPSPSRWGRRISNFLIAIETGATVTDSQCGFRVYPLKLIQSLRCNARRYGFESEILTRAAWAGIDIQQINVNCIYLVPEGRVTHFRLYSDTAASVMMHVRLLAISALPGPEWRFDRDAKTAKIWRRLARWLNPIRSWSELKCHSAERHRFATALAIGVFIANLPLFGVQGLLSICLARFIRLNPVPAVMGSLVSTPPIGPLLIAAAIGVGHFCRFGNWPLLQNFNPKQVGYVALMKSVFVEWTIGGIICGLILAIMAYALSRLALTLLPANTPAVQAADPRAPVTARDLAVLESAVSEP